MELAMDHYESSSWEEIRRQKETSTGPFWRPHVHNNDICPDLIILPPAIGNRNLIHI
jgi:hypothetical protein